MSKYGALSIFGNVPKRVSKVRQMKKAYKRGGQKPPLTHYKIIIIFARTLFLQMQCTYSQSERITGNCETVTSFNKIGISV